MRSVQRLVTIGIEIEAVHLKQIIWNAIMSAVDVTNGKTQDLVTREGNHTYCIVSIVPITSNLPLHVVR